MTDRPVRVFISSTYLDNEDRRRTVEDAVIRAGMVPVAMERFTAAPQPPLEECLRLVADESDVFVGILAWRYGWIPPGHERSICELEYDAAKAAGLERLMFQLDDSVPVNPRDDFDPGPDRWPKQQKLDAFKQHLPGEVTVARFKDDTLGAATLQALNEWRKRRAAPAVREAAPLRVGALPLDAQITRYLASLASHHATVSLAGFETRVRVPILLEDLHVPLTAVVDLSAREAAAFADAGHASELLRGGGHSLEVPLADAFACAGRFGARRGLVILGDPGSGKTTHLKRLLLAIARNSPESVGLPAGSVPVFLPLRNLAGGGASFDREGLDTFIQRELASPHLGLDAGFAHALVERGNLIYLLDGLDEVADASDRARVARYIADALSYSPTCRFVVTCRYAGYSGEARLPADFLELHLRPLDEMQARAFVHNWYRIVETSLADDKPKAEERACTEANALIERLRAPAFRAARVFELTRNPLLLTTICLVHRDGAGSLPDRRARLYDECIKILLERWREAKKLPNTVPGEKARLVLQPLAYWLHGEEGRTQATAEQMVPIINQALGGLRASLPSGERFLQSIRDESGLLTGWSGQSYGFMHLGFQEYLAAREIRRLGADNPEVLRHLAGQFGKSWWREVTLLLVTLDDPSVGERFVRFLIEEPAFGRYPEWIAELAIDAGDKVEEPFAALLREPPGQDRDLWQRQRAALRALQAVAPDLVASLAGQLRSHPDLEISLRFVTTGRRKEITLAPSGIRMVLIPGGRFLMGSPESEVGRRDDEGPQREVELSPFYLARTPVTNEQYGRYLNANPGASEPQHWGDRRFNQPQQPVVGVSWDEAQSFAAWTGARLPTEAQWEYACRAGTTTATYAGNLTSLDEDLVLRDIAWYGANSEDRTQPVGSKKVNAWGLSDMLGNVLEWCFDEYGKYPPTPAKDPEGAYRGDGRVLRGGPFDVVAGRVRAATRDSDVPSLRDRGIGFRVARGASRPEGQGAEAAEPRRGHAGRKGG